MTEKEILEKVKECMTYVSLDFNNRTTRSFLKSLLIDALKDIKGGHEVICDETNNTPEIIKNNMLAVDVDGYHVVFRSETTSIPFTDII